MIEQISRLNRLLYRVERAFVTSALLAMAVVVFLDVLHRTFVGESTKGVEAFIKVIDWFGPDLAATPAAHASAHRILPWIAFAGFAALGWAAARAATGRRMPHAQAAGLGAAAMVVAYGLIQLLVRALPNGLIWSQPFALVLTLWVGFIGASMATYEHKHLKVDAVTRLVPVHLRKYVGLVSALGTTLFCFAMMWVSIRYVSFAHDEYVSTKGQGGNFAGLGVPKYVGFMALPIAFAIMTARFLGAGVLAWQGKLQEDDPLAGLVDDATKLAVAAASAPPSDIPTEAIRPIRDEAPVKPTGQKRPAAVAGDIVAERPSEVVTDRHGAAGPDKDGDA